MVRLPRNESKHIDWTLGLKCDHRVWPWPWPWPWIFKVRYEISYISAKNGPIATKRKANISIDLKASNVTIRFDLGHDLDLEFLRSNMEFPIPLPKMARLPRNESKHIDWSQGLKCDHWVWPWPWPWYWIFKVKYGISYISAKNSQIATKWKANISIELQASNVTNGFDLGHDLDIRIFKVKCDLDHLVTKVSCKDLPDSDRGDFRCRRAIDSSSFVWLTNICTNACTCIFSFSFPVTLNAHFMTIMEDCWKANSSVMWTS